MKLRGLLVRSTITAALGGLLFGFDTAVIAGCTKEVKQLFTLSDSMLGFMVASALIGTILGSVFIGKPGDTYGRRICLKVTGCLFLISISMAGYLLKIKEIGELGRRLLKRGGKK